MQCVFFTRDQKLFYNFYFLFFTTAILFCVNYFVVLENLESSLKKGSSDEAFSTLLNQLRTTNLD